MADDKAPETAPETPTDESPETAPETPTDDTIGVDDLAPAPATARKISGSIDDVFAAKVYALASTNVNGASTNRVYPSRDDARYKADARKMRLHLASRLDPTTQRAAIVVFAAPGGTGITFGAQIKTKSKRKPRKSA